MAPEGSAKRRLFMVLSPRSLPYARLALGSLFRNCSNDFSLSLITDSNDDVNSLIGALDGLETNTGDVKRTVQVLGEAELADLHETKFGKFEHIREFRRGHPCWRKITDPILLSEDRDEMVVLDPDLYFPNRFSFEPTADAGVFLMWQRPSCLLPDEVVRRAIAANIALAHHTDIGVAQWRIPVDLDWLDWLIEKIGSSQWPHSMHVESIVWAALAMRLGGGYLDPASWVCWHRTQYKRLLVKLGMAGASILKQEAFATMKCFHAGGEAKWWLASAQASGILDSGREFTCHSAIKPYRELVPAKYYSLQRNRRLLRKCGYYSLLGG